MTTDIWVALGAIGTFLAALAALIPVLRRKPKKLPDEAVDQQIRGFILDTWKTGESFSMVELLKRIEVERDDARRVIYDMRDKGELETQSENPLLSRGHYRRR